MLKIQVHQMSSEPEKGKNIWAKETCEFKELLLWLSNVNVLIWEGVCVCMWEIKIILFQNWITLLWSAILQIRMDTEEKSGRPIENCTLHKSVSWCFTNSTDQNVSYVANLPLAFP